ncbi:MAG: tail fiber domain-containing protein [Cryomorphaceae bacterium]|nr:MAG: tail fiber domain-containing protein [Cryomorphaceae bacterium]
MLSKFFYSAFIFCAVCQYAIAQNVAINETGDLPHPSAMLEITSNDKGILIPRVNDHMSVPGPAQGLLVYDTADNNFWYFDGTVWRPLMSSGDGWLLEGNDLTDPSVNFLGTLDEAAMMFRVNNSAAGRLDYEALTAGNVVGTKGATALGFEALGSNTAGYHNTAFGFQAGGSVTVNHNNTYFGYQAGTSSVGFRNTFIGSGSGAAMGSGANMTIIGADAFSNAPAGQESVWIGAEAGMNTTTGGARNIVLGFRAGMNQAGNDNIILGHSAGLNFTNNRNVVIGTDAALTNENSARNVIIGWSANSGVNSTFGPSDCVIIGTLAGRAVRFNGNVFVGERSGQWVVTGADNTFIGKRAGSGVQSSGSVGENSAGNSNVAVGSEAGRDLQNGAMRNTIVGTQAGQLSTSGERNTFIGWESGRNVTSGSGNVYIGSQSGSGSIAGYTGAANNRFLLSNAAGSAGVLMSGHFDDKRVGINTINPTQTLSVNGDAGKPGGGEWDTFSDQRLKTDVSSFDDGLQVVLRLRPVEFRYNELSGYQDLSTPYIGFLAQDVESIAPYMVRVMDDSQGPSGLSDLRVLKGDALSKVLVNAIQEQQEQISSLEERIEQLEKLVLEMNGTAASAEK